MAKTRRRYGRKMGRKSRRYRRGCTIEDDGTVICGGARRKRSRRYRGGWCGECIDLGDGLPPYCPCF